MERYCLEPMAVPQYPESRSSNESEEAARHINRTIVLVIFSFTSRDIARFPSESSFDRLQRLPCADRKGIESFSRREAANLPHRVIDLHVDRELPQLHR